MLFDKKLPNSSVVVANWVNKIGFSGTLNQPKDGFKAGLTMAFLRGVGTGGAEGACAPSDFREGSPKKSPRLLFCFIKNICAPAVQNLFLRPCQMPMSKIKVH